MTVRLFFGRICVGRAEKSPYYQCWVMAARQLNSRAASRTFLAKLLEQDDEGQAMQPSGQAEFSAMSVQLAEYLQENLPGQVFSFSWVACHA